MESITNDQSIDKELTPLETLLAEMIFCQLLQTAKQDMKERGFSCPYEYVSAILVEYYLRKQEQENCFKSRYHYKTRRNGNCKRKVHRAEN